MRYDVNDWVSKMIGKDPSEVWAETDKHYMFLKSRSNQLRKIDGYYRYMSSLNGFLYFIQTLSQPAGESMYPYMPIIEDWVARGILSKNPLSDSSNP